MLHNNSTADEDIRAARERFNIAIAEQDMTMIRSLLAPTYHIVTGRSAQNHGADEEAARWADVFRSDPTTVYRRAPREITVNAEWGLAEELGDWKGSYTANGSLIHATGVYAAKWQCAEDGDWVLQVEVFTTLSCTGPEAGCVRPEPIHR